MERGAGVWFVFDCDWDCISYFDGGKGGCDNKESTTTLSLNKI